MHELMGILCWTIKTMQLLLSWQGYYISPIKQLSLSVHAVMCRRVLPLSFCVCGRQHVNQDGVFHGGEAAKGVRPIYEPLKVNASNSSTQSKELGLPLGSKGEPREEGEARGWSMRLWRLKMEKTTEPRRLYYHERPRQQKKSPIRWNPNECYLCGDALAGPVLQEKAYHLQVILLGCHV